jgi:hypothetical protein
MIISYLFIYIYIIIIIVIVIVSVMHDIPKMLVFPNHPVVIPQLSRFSKQRVASHHP